MSNGEIGVQRLAQSLELVGVRAPRARAGELLDELSRRYAEPHRAYHSMAHVESCLAWLDWYRAQAAHPAEVELALWFHDAVYDPQRTDNEARSAALAWSSLADMGASHEACLRVAELIQATGAHRSMQGDAALVCSIDLAVLGADWEAFEAYQSGVRTEYGHVSDAVFAAGRAAFLRGLRQREPIYANRAIREALELAARRNIERALAEVCTAHLCFSASKVP